MANMYISFDLAKLPSGCHPEWTPDSLLQCLGPDGNINIRSFLTYQQHMADVAAASSAVKRALEENDGPDIEDRPAKKTRGPKKICAYREEGGELEHILPEETVWYKLYVLGPMCDDEDWCKKFRQRFRLPYRCFLDLVNEAAENDWFPRWARASDPKKSSPLELMILGALRYLGRGWTFDDLEESTAISAEVHRVFFHEVSPKLLFWISDCYVHLFVSQTFHFVYISHPVRQDWQHRPVQEVCPNSPERRRGEGSRQRV